MPILRRSFVFVAAPALCVLLAGWYPAFLCLAAPPQAISRSGGPSVRLEAERQRKVGDVFFADGNVEIQYQKIRLYADHVQYNTKTEQASARGDVRLDVDNQHLEADSAEFNVRTGQGHFTNVRGEVRVRHQPNASVLVTPNPLYFQAQQVQRLSKQTYVIDHVWLTVCEPNKPSWKFFAKRATLHVGKSVALVNANFRLFRVPLLYLPYATVPAGRTLRQSGFLLPEFSNTSLNGLVLGDGYYWAPKQWTDLTLGGAYLSRRGWEQEAEFRARPMQNVDFSSRYFGVIDRLGKGGHTTQVELDAHLDDGWHAALDLNELSSLTFRLAFAPTFGEAVNSEVRTSGFLTKSFHGFSVGFAGQNYKDFLTIQQTFPLVQAETSVVLRTAPEARISSVDQAPWKHLPIYFGGDAFAGGVHRDDPQINTPAVVERSEFAPRVVVPLRWGPWLGVTTSYTVRTTSYGAQILSGGVVDDPLRRTTGELNVDIRPPSLERVWQTRGSKWKHTIEPAITYNYVRGVNQFDRFIRVGQDDTLTDTNEFEYSITQRLFRRSGDAQANEIVNWSLAQKYYFDPTFNGALVPGTRNVFQSLASITPFAFAEFPRHFSPIVSDLRVTPGGSYDAEVLLNYDTVRNRFTTAGTLLKLRPTQNLNFTVAHFSIDNTNVLQPVSNQIRAQVGYGALNRRGWNALFGFSYDIRQQFLQNQIVQISYNGSCCGIALEYRRLALGPVRTENQFRVALIIANLGTFGNLRRQEKIF